MVSVDKMFIFSKGLVSKLLPPPLWTSDRTQLSSHVVRLRQTESVFCFKLWSDFPLGYWTGRTSAIDQCTLSTNRFISKHVGWNRCQNHVPPQFQRVDIQEVNCIHGGTVYSPWDTDRSIGLLPQVIAAPSIHSVIHQTSPTAILLWGDYMCYWMFIK